MNGQDECFDDSGQCSNEATNDIIITVVEYTWHNYTINNCHGYQELSQQLFNFKGSGHVMQTDQLAQYIQLQ